MDEFFKWRGPKKSAGIRMVVMDMWRPFRNSTQRHAPQASTLFDKFHVVRHLGDALDRVRKAEYARLSGNDRRFINGQKYTLLANRENLTLEGKRSLKLILAANKRLNAAYMLKESFGQLWSYNREAWAGRSFENWRASLKGNGSSLREIRCDDRASLGWDRCLLQAGEQGRAWLRRGAEQQDPPAPAPSVRFTRRGVPPAQDTQSQVAAALA